MGARLTQTRTVMTVSSKTRMFPSNTVPFDCQDEDVTRETEGDGAEEDVYRSHQLFLDKMVWDHMGQPETITVTVQPGDKLNEEEDTNVDYVRIYEDVAGDWRWAAIARNGKEVSSGQGHRDAHDAKRAANGVLGHDVEFREEN